MGPLENEIRERLSKSPFNAEHGDKTRAAGGTGNGGLEIGVEEILSMVLRALTDLENVAVRLAAEIDRLANH